MIHIRDEGHRVKQGLNFYPRSSNQLGFVLRICNSMFTIRYNKKLGKIKCQKHSTI
jgi:hypothetical protein